MNRPFRGGTGGGLAFAGAVLAGAAIMASGSSPVEPPADLRGAALGPIVDSGRGPSERVAFDARLADSLLALAPERTVAFADWPVAPGVRRGVHLARHEVYAPGARMIRVDARGETDVPRSRWVFFWGHDDAGGQVMVSVDPDARVLRGLSRGAEGFHEFGPDAADPAGRSLLVRSGQTEDGPARRFTCAQEDAEETRYAFSGREGLSRVPMNLSSLHTATVAFDTDNELMAYYGNNVTTATNYVASLVASINVIYERDLNLRLLQGTTFYRVSTTTDPYSQGPDVNGSATNAQLNEFASYWSTNEGGVTRAVAAMLSGKSPSGNSASGIAAVSPTPLCSTTNGYSFSQVFKINYLSGDTLIVGHEIGHNLTSPHTHCYADPAPDRCWNGESCYTGAQICPTPQTISGLPNVTGTLMSYCHLTGCGSNEGDQVFHPFTVDRYIGPALSNAVGVCVFPFGGGPTPTPTATPTRTPTRTPTPTPPPPPPPVSGATTFHSLTPCRVLDTRNAIGPLGGPALGALGSRIFVATGVCGVPAGAVAVSANATAVAPAVTGDLVLYPNGMPAAPNASSLGFRAGVTRANNSVVYLAGDGSFVVKNNSSGALNFVLDVNGYFQ